MMRVAADMIHGPGRKSSKRVSRHIQSVERVGGHTSTTEKNTEKQKWPFERMKQEKQVLL